MVLWHIFAIVLSCFHYNVHFSGFSCHTGRCAKWFPVLQFPTPCYETDERERPLFSLCFLKIHYTYIKPSSFRQECVYPGLLCDSTSHGRGNTMKSYLNYFLGPSLELFEQKDDVGVSRKVHWLNIEWYDLICHFIVKLPRVKLVSFIKNIMCLLLKLGKLATLTNPRLKNSL